VSTLAPNAVIKDVLDIDSLGLVDMVALVEGLFGVKIHADEIASILTLENLYDYIERKTEKEFI
jgi:acyl carrier protein